MGTGPRHLPRLVGRHGAGARATLWRVTTTGSLFLAESARFLRDVHGPRLERAARALGEGDLWWRPHPGALAVGTILLHLEGNLRQWILSGLGGLPDERDRAAEFAARGGAGVEELLGRLRETLAAASRVIEGLPPGRLTEPCRIQGQETDPLRAVLHVVEHFSWHTGQAVWIAKARGGPDHGIAFYDDAAVNAARNARG